jgi:glucose/arabinose dehydrogenase
VFSPKHFLIPLLAALACVESQAPVGPPADRLGLTVVAVGLVAPVLVTAPPGDSNRVFIVERNGRVRIVRDDTLLTRPFLDLIGGVRFADEQGLLALAFHPDYATNGRFYVHFTNVAGDTRVVRYHVTADPDSADEASGDTVLAVDQVNFFHQGGTIAFGADGYLYIALGDGAAASGYSPLDLRGKILRLDVDSGTPYVIPRTNPYVGQVDTLPEIWALGLRNPWRISFDRQTHDLYIGDVGQLDWEEINVEAAGGSGGVNYGWPVFEGTHCYAATTCDSTGKQMPVHEYSHGEGCAVIGGYVYRGVELPELQGRYLFSDYCTARVWSFRYMGGVATDLRDHTALLSPGCCVTSFGEDARGELYLLTVDASQAGRAYRISRVPALGAAPEMRGTRQP